MTGDMHCDPAIIGLRPNKWSNRRVDKIDGRPLGGVDNILGRLVKDGVIIRLHPDAYSFVADARHASVPSIQYDPDPGVYPCPALISRGKVRM